MNRRGFLKFLGQASVGAYVAYSFPSIIVPKNVDQLIIEPSLVDIINLTTKKEIYPELIHDLFFRESSWYAYLKSAQVPPTMFEDSINAEPIFFINSKEISLVKNVRSSNNI